MSQMLVFVLVFLEEFEFHGRKGQECLLIWTKLKMSFWYISPYKTGRTVTSSSLGFSAQWCFCIGCPDQLVGPPQKTNKKASPLAKQKAARRVQNKNIGDKASAKARGFTLGQRTVISMQCTAEITVLRVAVLPATAGA